jgi:hypothetical protein
LNFGQNVSPEGLSQGYDTVDYEFSSATDRDSIYLPHPFIKSLYELVCSPIPNPVLFMTIGNN